MHKIYDMWPEIAKKSYKSDQDAVDFTDIDHIVFAGMGGSGALGDIFSSILSKTKIHVAVTKGYHLPNTADSNTLVIATSISGNTVETLSVLNSAKKADCKIVAFSSGGKMQGYCVKNKIEYRNIPQLHSPRASFTGFLYTILKVLGPVLPIKKHDILNSITELESLSKQISSDNLTEKNPSLRLAQWISGIPIIYYPYGLQAAAIRFKNSLQENSKIHVMAEDILEASHNGIVSWEKQSIVQPILLEGYDDYIKTKERWKIIKEYFQKNKIDYKEIFSIKGNILSKLINLIYLLDYSTIYRAVLSGIDPSPIQSIDFIKSKLSSRLE
jgi:glucose/mannose-6-phosphate isomerase